MSPSSAQTRVFEERPTGLFVADAFRFASIPIGLAVLAFGLGAGWLGWLFAGLAVFVFAFFRNPERIIAGDARTVVAPADGRVVEVGQFEDEGGDKRVRIGIFLSVFNVHVNRAPVAGRVVSVERAGERFLAAFDAAAATHNVRSTLTLETERGEKVEVVQITGLIARRIVSHPRVGEWLERGVRFGLIRFGSRTDVTLPAGSEAQVKKGDRVRGGSSVLARLPGGSA